MREMPEKERRGAEKGRERNERGRKKGRERDERGRKRKEWNGME